MPRNSNLDPDPPEFPASSRMPRWLLILSVITMLVVLSMGYVSLQVVHRIRKYKRLAAEIQENYQAADARLTFSLPQRPESPTSERIEAYYRARQSFVQAVDPPMEERAHAILESEGTASVVDVAQLFGQFYNFLERGTHAHLVALEKEHMGPSEYLWIHGYVVANVLNGAPTDPRRQQLETTLKALEGSETGVDQEGENFVADAFRKDLRKEYGAFPPLAPGDLTGYEVPGDLIACVDILAATPKLQRDLGLKGLQASDRSTSRSAFAFRPLELADAENSHRN